MCKSQQDRRKKMRKCLYLLLHITGMLILIFSAPLGYNFLKILYANTNLTGEYVPLLNGSIYSFRLAGLVVLVCPVVIQCLDLLHEYLPKNCSE